MARGKAEKQPFQMHPSLRQHLFSVQRYLSNTGQVQNMSMLLEVTVQTRARYIRKPTVTSNIWLLIANIHCLHPTSSLQNDFQATKTQILEILLMKPTL